MPGAEGERGISERIVGHPSLIGCGRVALHLTEIFPLTSNMVLEARSLELFR